MSARLRPLVVAACAAALVVTSVPSAPSAGAVDPTRPPPSVGRVVERAAPYDGRAADAASVRRALQGVVDAGAVGVVAAVSDDTGTVRSAAGRSWIGRNAVTRPARADAKFRAASITKMFTSVLALQMIDEGRWTLRTTIGDVAPRLWPRKRNVTLGQLLSHRSGLRDYLTPIVRPAGASPTALQRVLRTRRTEASLMRVAKQQRAAFAPGRGFRYSNTNFLVVGLMLERANRTGLGTLVRQRILRPAGMTSSTYASTPRMKGPSLHEYALYPRNRLVDLVGFQPVLFSGAGAIVSTTADLDRFQRALSDGRLISPTMLRVMRTPLSDVQAAGYVYGYGSYRLPDPCVDGGQVFGHDGASFGTHSLTLTSGDGRRRVTIAMTGRSFTKSQKAFVSMVDTAFTLLGSTCDSVGQAPSTSG